MELQQAKRDIAHNDGRLFEQLPDEGKLRLQREYESREARAEWLLKLVSCAFWWFITAATVASPWWAQLVFTDGASLEFLRSPLFIGSQAFIAVAFVAVNLLSAPWRVIPKLKPALAGE